MSIKGYKVFNPDWTCRGFQYEVGKTYEMEDKPELCKKGFHFCLDLENCFKYYDFNFNIKVAEILALGSIDGDYSREEDKDKDKDKFCTNKIKIVKEIPFEEVLKLMNSGKSNLGYGNRGDYNTGNLNKGYSNIGSNNKGVTNTGDYNKGNSNIGWYNKGSSNIGRCNKGDFNIGLGNIGGFNTGNYNFGDDNVGDCNFGNGNVGDFNKIDNSIGCFNTKEPTLYMFNKPTNWTIKAWRTSKAYSLLRNYIISKRNKTGASKNEWWLRLSEEDKQEILSLPNFDTDIFKEIMGIDVEEKK